MPSRSVKYIFYYIIDNPILFQKNDVNTRLLIIPWGKGSDKRGRTRLRREGSKGSKGSEGSKGGGGG
jgi:hypothetical protein